MSGAAKAINARPAARDDGVRDAQDCDITREVTLGRNTAAYLSLYAGEGGICGRAAHPQAIDFRLTFDRASGRPGEGLRDHGAGRSGWRSARTASAVSPFANSC